VEFKENNSLAITWCMFMSENDKTFPNEEYDTTAFSSSTTYQNMTILTAYTGLKENLTSRDHSIILTFIQECVALTLVWPTCAGTLAQRHNSPAATNHQENSDEQHNDNIQYAPVCNTIHTQTFDHSHNNEHWLVKLLFPSLSSSTPYHQNIPTAYYV
jgi:hypothetical protein